VINGVFNAHSGLKNSAQKYQKSATSLQNYFGFEKNIDMVGKTKLGKSELIDTNSTELVAQITAKAAFTANTKVVVTAEQIIGTTLDIKS